MEDDPDEIYSAPAENEKTNFADIRKRFEKPGGGIPIKVAHDGRHQNKDPDCAGTNKPAKSFKPNAANKPKLFEGNKPPSLPTKKISPKSPACSPPKLPEKEVNGAALLARANRLSERPESMFPPAGDKGSDPNNNIKKGPLPKPRVNGLVSPTAPSPPSQRTKDNSPKGSLRELEVIHTPKGIFKKRPLPPEGQKPPPKPPSIPDSEVRLPTASIGGHPVLTAARSITEAKDIDGVEPDQIYDDIGTPQPSAAKSPPPNAHRPVSMIPEMGEDDEEDLSDGELNRRLCVAAKGRLPTVTGGDSDQETYDDVAPGPPPASASHPPEDMDPCEEIYEDI